MCGTMTSDIGSRICEAFRQHKLATGKVPCKLFLGEKEMTLYNKHLTDPEQAMGLNVYEVDCLSVLEVA